MASSTPYWIPLVSTLLGAGAGFLAGLFSDRFKTQVAAIEAELERLDTIQDDALDILNNVAQGATSETLRNLTKDRTRLGKNLRRELSSAQGSEPVERDLALFSKELGRVQDAAEAKALLAADQVDQLDHRAENLRRSVRRAASSLAAWRVMRRT